MMDNVVGRSVAVEKSPLGLPIKSLIRISFY